MFLEFAPNDDGVYTSKQQCNGLEFTYKLRMRNDVGIGHWDCIVEVNGNPFRDSAVFETFEEANIYAERIASGIALGDFDEEMSYIRGYSPRIYGND